jgi:hypothetical protein
MNGRLMSVCIVVCEILMTTSEQRAAESTRNLVTVRALDDADAGIKREQVLELAPENRNLSMGAWLMVVADAVRAVSMSGASLVTVTVSVRPDTFMATGRWIDCPTVSARSPAPPSRIPRA